MHHGKYQCYMSASHAYHLPSALSCSTRATGSPRSDFARLSTALPKCAQCHLASACEIIHSRLQLSAKAREIIHSRLQLSAKAPSVLSVANQGDLQHTPCVQPDSNNPRHFLTPTTKLNVLNLAMDTQALL